MNASSSPRKAGSLLDGLWRLRRQAENTTLSSRQNRRISNLRAKTESSKIFDPLFAHDNCGHVDNDREAIREARYHELINEIEAAIRGKEVPIVTLHANDVVEGAVGPISGRSTRLHYSIALPNRPSDVSVHMTRVSGPIPAMYASVDNERPSSSEFDIEAQDGELFYHHEPEEVRRHDPEEEDEQRQRESFRRPKSAIKARDDVSPLRQRRHVMLFICVESSEAVCEYRLRCSVRRIAQPEPIAQQQDVKIEVQTFQMARSRLHSRLAELKCNTIARREFDDHLLELQQKRKKSWRQDFCAFNKRHAEDYMPEVQEEFRALRRQNEERRKKIVHRRQEDIERQLDQKHQSWVGREEEKKRLKAEADALQEKEEEMVMRKNAWLEKVVVITYAIKLCQEAQKQKKIYKQTMKEFRASQMLQQYVLKRLTKQRRIDLYTNVIRCRCAMVAYIRHSRIALANMAAPSLRWFLQTYALKFQEPDMLSLLKRFVGRVKFVQRTFRKRKLMRQARVEALLNCFYAADFIAEEEKYLKAEEAQRISSRKGSKEQIESVKAKRGIVRRQNTKDSYLSRSATKTESQKNRITAQQRMNTESAPRVNLDLHAKPADAHVIPAFARDYKGTELLPDFVRKRVLTQHVHEMQSSFRARLKEWTRRKVESQEAEDLHAMGFTDLEHRRFLEPRPRALELHRLKGLYSATYDAWLHGDFKGLVIDRNRTMMKFFGIWRRAHHHVQEKRLQIPHETDHDLVHKDAQSIRHEHQKQLMKRISGAVNRSISEAFASGF